MYAVLYLRTHLSSYILFLMNEQPTYIVFDLEWNQCPYGKDRENSRLPFEIIDIGAVALNEKKEIIGHYHQFIKPVVYKKLHFRTREVIGIDRKELDKGAHFPHAVIEFFKFCGEDPIFCTWGDQDLLELQRNLQYYGMLSRLPGPLRYADVQKLFAITFETRKTRRSLEYAADFLGFQKDSTFHRAYDDALYTAAVLKEIPDETIRNELSLDSFQNPKSRDEEILIRRKGYEKFISMEYASRDEALRDPVATRLHCPVCGRNIKRILRWTPAGHRNYVALGLCGEHGYADGRIHLRKADEDRLYVERVVQSANDETAEKILGKFRKQ